MYMVSLVEGGMSVSSKSKSPVSQPQKGGFDPSESDDFVFFDDARPFVRESENRMFVNGLARGMQVLTAFQKRPGPLGNKDFAEITGMNKATVCRITHTLTQLGFLEKNTSRFEIGPRTLSLGYPYLATQRIRDIAYPYLAEIADQGVYTLGIAAPDSIAMVYILEGSSQKLNSLRLDVGARVEMARTAMGRAYLGGLGPGGLKDHYRAFANHYGSKEWAQLEPRVSECVSEVHGRGFCFIDREWRDDLRAIAVPILDRTGNVKLALNCAGPTMAVSEQTLTEDIGPHLVRLAREFTRML